MNNCDIAWMLVATALVLLMTPALGFFYGGLVRSKNALNTVMMSVSALGFVGIAWALAGYSIAFGNGSAWAGDFSHVLLSGVGLEPQGSIPHVLFFSYQGTFAIITAALISGAIVERMRFGPYLAFLFLWSIAVYAPVAHWVWGGGWLAKLGALDFAGGTVVHVNAAAAALVAAIVLKPRKDYARRAILPHNVPFTLLGAGLLWFGWFGFNAGSALAANSIAANFRILVTKNVWLSLNCDPARLVSQAFMNQKTSGSAPEVCCFRDFANDLGGRGCLAGTLGGCLVLLLAPPMQVEASRANDADQDQCRRLRHAGNRQREVSGDRGGFAWRPILSPGSAIAGSNGRVQRAREQRKSALAWGRTEAGEKLPGLLCGTTETKR